MCRNRKTKPQVHTGRITLYGCVDEGGHSGKVNDAVKLGSNFALLHSQQRPIKIDIFAPGQLRMKAGGDFNQSRQPPIDSDLAFGRSCNVVEQLENGALACAILPDDSQCLAALDLKTNVAQGPEILPAAPNMSHFAQRCRTTVLPRRRTIDAVPLGNTIE